MANPTRFLDRIRPLLIPNPKAKLMDQVREVMRFHHYAFRTEKSIRARAEPRPTGGSSEFRV